MYCKQTANMATCSKHTLIIKIFITIIQTLGYLWNQWLWF